MVILSNKKIQGAKKTFIRKYIAQKSWHYSDGLDIKGNFFCITFLKFSSKDTMFMHIFIQLKCGILKVCPHESFYLKRTDISELDEIEKTLNVYKFVDQISDERLRGAAYKVISYLLVGEKIENIKKNEWGVSLQKIDKHDLKKLIE